MTSPYIDEERWPHLVATPHARFMSRRAEGVTSRLESLLSSRGIGLDAGSVPHMVVRDGQVIDRVVAEGWLGLAEGYMAGEWNAEPLPEILGILLAQPFEGKVGEFFARRSSRRRGPLPGELPEALVELYAGASRATGAAQFSSASRTSAHDQGIDFTWFGDPDPVERLDLDDAQRRRINTMLDEAEVGPGDRVLEMPSSGGQLAVQAARRGARVDVLTSDEEHAAAVRARVHSAGVGGAVNVELIPGPVPSPRQWSGRYEAIFSVERMETLGLGGLSHYLKAVDRMLSDDGLAVIQSIVATEEMRETARESLDVMRAYVWPALEYPTVGQVREAAAENTQLRVVAENNLSTHLRATLPLWRANFLSRERQAAAAGFDPVFRRLWDYQLALHEALATADDIGCVQFVLAPK